MPDYPAFNVGYGLVLSPEPRNFPLKTVAHYMAVERKSIYVDLQPGNGRAYRLVLTPLKGVEDMSEVRDRNFLLSIPNSLWSRLMDFETIMPTDFRSVYHFDLQDHDVLAWWLQCLWLLMLENHSDQMDLRPKVLHGVIPKKEVVSG